MHILHCEYGRTKKGELNQRKAAFSWMWRLTEMCSSSKQRTRQRHLLLNTGWQTWHKDKTRGSSLHVDGVFTADGGSQEATLDYFLDSSSWQQRQTCGEMGGTSRQRSHMLYSVLYLQCKERWHCWGLWTDRYNSMGGESSVNQSKEIGLTMQHLLYVAYQALYGRYKAKALPPDLMPLIQTYSCHYTCF